MSRNRKVLGITALLIVGYFALKYGILLFTPKPQIPTDVQERLDSLTTVATQLQAKQERLDILLMQQDSIIYELDNKINTTQQSTTVVRKYYVQKGEAASKYNPSQVDSFLQDRYNY